MISPPSARRWSARDYLTLWPQPLFPPYFDSLMHPFFASLLPLDTDARVEAAKRAFPKIQAQVRAAVEEPEARPLVSSGDIHSEKESDATRVTSKENDSMESTGSVETDNKAHKPGTGIAVETDGAGTEATARERGGTLLDDVGALLEDAGRLMARFKVAEQDSKGGSCIILINPWGWLCSITHLLFSCRCGLDPLHRSKYRSIRMCCKFDGGGKASVLSRKGWPYISSARIPVSSPHYFPYLPTPFLIQVNVTSNQIESRLIKR